MKKFNILDYIIIFIIIIAIVLVTMGSFNSKSTQILKPTKMVRYVIELQNNDENVAKQIKVDDDIKDAIKNVSMGKIIQKETIPATKITENIIEGTFNKSEIPNKQDIRLTIEVIADITEKDVIVNNYDIRTGKEVVIKGKGYAGKGYITSVEVE